MCIENEVKKVHQAAFSAGSADRRSSKFRFLRNSGLYRISTNLTSDMTEHCYKSGHIIVFFKLYLKAKSPKIIA